MMQNSDPYIPALGLDILTPLYDPVLHWVFQEMRFKQQLVNQASIHPGQRVLDLGCGTGTLTLLIKQAYPDADVIGLDGDFTVLTLARAKAEKAGVPLAFNAGMAFALPYPDQTFDRVLTSLVLHHLTTNNKQRTLHDVYRVLQPGGVLYVLDFGKPHTMLAYLISLVVRNFEQVADNIQGLLPILLGRAGFTFIEETTHFMTIAGTLTLYKAQKPV